MPRVRSAALLPLGLVLVLFAGACSAGPAQPIAVAPAASASLAPLASIEPRALSLKAVQAAGAAQYFHVQGTGAMSATNAETKETQKIAFQVEGDVQMPDRYRQNITLSTGGKDVTREVVQIGTQIWSRTAGTTEWSVATGASGTALGGFDPRDGIQGLAALTDVKDLGAQTVEGKAAHHLQGSFDAASLATKGAGELDASTLEFAKALLGDAKGTVEAWITDDGRLLRQKVTSTLTVFGTAIELTFDLSYSKFEQPPGPPIEAPKVGPASPPPSEAPTTAP